MSEQAKPNDLASRLLAPNSALDDATQNRRLDAQQQQKNLFQMRARLGEIASEVAPKVRVFVTENGSSFGVDIGNASSAFRKPFASLDVRVKGTGYHVSDRNMGHGRYAMPVNATEDEEGVVTIVRGVAAEYVLQKRALLYEFPEWYTALITIAAGIVAVGTWLLCWLLFGLPGFMLGWMAMLIVFYSLKAVGPIGVVAAVAGYVIYLAAGAPTIF